jgi:hypothetical protein
MPASTLVYLLHGYGKTPAQLSDVIAVTRACIPDARIEAPLMPMSVLSYSNPCEIVSALLLHIDRLDEQQEFDRIVLVGFSTGSLLARKLYIAACGTNRRAPLESPLLDSSMRPRRWAAAVERIVLLAGINNGWRIDYHLSLGRAAAFSFGLCVARFLSIFRIGARERLPLILNMKRGAPFLTQLRLQWLAMRKEVALANKPVGEALVVQLLGTVDDMVSPEDNIDLVAGHDFCYLEVPKSNHASVLEMSDPTDGSRRAEVYRRALTSRKSELVESSVPVFDVNPIHRDDRVTDVVFVIHGIRDQGYWTQRVARAVVQEAKAGSQRFAHVTSTYGYFGMFPFLRPWKRREKVEWLMDKYADALARYPNAERFHFVGHSNGTYLLARAIKEYSCCQFHRVVFAGSVVKAAFDWKSLMHPACDPPRVQRVLNFAASGDWVVACFPNLFEKFRQADLGGAGHHGFRFDSESGYQQVNNIRYVAGGHGAALDEDNWDQIAKFVVHGDVVAHERLRVPWKRSHDAFAGFFGRVPILAWLLVVVGLAVIPVTLLWGLAHFAWPEWFVTAGMIAYLGSIWFVGNRL